MINVAVDIETTGLKAGVHDIIEFAVLEYDETNGEATGLKFVSRMRPINPKMINEKAMAINKIPLRELEYAPTPMSVRKMFIEWKNELFGDMRFRVLGTNYDGFDRRFLELWLGDFYEDIFHYHARDLWQLADICRRLGLISLESLKLESLRDYLGLVHQVHTAEGDCMLTIKAYKKLFNTLQDMIL